jgi:hypothetical protein
MRRILVMVQITRLPPVRWPLQHRRHRQRCVLGPGGYERSPARPLCPEPWHMPGAWCSAPRPCIPPTNRIVSCAIRPWASATPPVCSTLWPRQRRGAAYLGQPGFSTHRGRAHAAGPKSPPLGVLNRGAARASPTRCTSPNRAPRDAGSMLCCLPQCPCPRSPQGAESLLWPPESLGYHSYCRRACPAAAVHPLSPLTPTLRTPCVRSGHLPLLCPYAGRETTRDIIYRENWTGH